MRLTRQIGVLLVLLTAAGCASSGGGGGTSANFSRQIGTSPRAETDSKTRLILQRHQFVMEREEGAASRETNLYFETQWRPRVPFDDEAALGAQAAETRVIVRARPRVRGSDVYNVSIAVENRLRMADGAWQSPPATPEFTAYAREISEELQRELLQGIRVR